jgi:hypothetical protein
MSMAEREFISNPRRAKLCEDYFSPKMKKLYLILIVELTLLFFGFGNSIAQWKKIQTFGAGHYPRVIYFNKWGIGFIGIQPIYGDPLSEVWRSSDNGQTWHETVVLNNPRAEDPLPDDFTFKDSLTGWCAATYGIFKTTDGGVNWSPDIQDNKAPRSVLYVPSSKLLLAGLWSGGQIFSIDDGINWAYTPTIPTAIPSYTTGFNGFAMLSDSIILMATGVIGNKASWYRSSDAGRSWLENSLKFESWQPYAEDSTDLFFSIPDYGSSVFRSNDKAISWKLIYNFPFNTYYADGLSGCIRGDKSGNLYVQSGNLSQQEVSPDAMYMSSDSGNSWTSICGPGNIIDTRFCIFNNKLFAGEYSYWTGEAGLWMLDLSKRWGILVDSGFTIASANCQSSSKAFYFSSTFPCFSSVTLDSVTVEGSSAFTASSQLYQQNGIGGSDSILVQYQSQNDYDTASLIFHFRVNGIQHDSSVTVYGIGGAPLAVSLYLKPSTITARAGDTIDIPVYLNGNATLSGVTLATASLALNSEVLEPIAFIPSLAGVSLAGPLSYSGGTGTEGTETVPLQINNLQLNGETMIGTLRCIIYLSDSLQTSVSLASASITSDDPRCLALSTSTDAVTISITGCGDSTLARFMQTGSPFTIESIVPNPAQNKITVDLSRKSEAPIVYDLFDELGRSWFHGLISGLQTSFSVTSLASGSYYIRVSTDGYVQTQKIQIER